MHATINTLLCLDGSIVNGVVSNYILDGSITSVCGMLSLEMGVFGGIVVGLGVSYLHNHFYQIQLPNVISFYEGERFVPIICAITYVFIGCLCILFGHHYSRVFIIWDNLYLTLAILVHLFMELLSVV